MSSKMKLPSESTQELDALSSSLRLRRNIICRMALGISLSDEEPPEIEELDSNGQEFNKPTILGTDEQVVYALVTQHFGQRIDPDEFFSTYVRAEIIRGLDILSSEYRRINSPVSFMRMLCGMEGELSLEQHR